MKYALLIGINYESTSGQLNGCINDVNNIKHILSTKLGYQTKNIKMLTDHHYEKPTKHNILKEINFLLEKARICSEIFFHYSGHGSYITDTNNDESDGRDECLVPLDYNQSGMISDDMLYDLFISKLPGNCHTTIIIDACHSGTCMDLPYQYNQDTDKWDKCNNFTVNNKNIIMLSGCQDHDVSSDAYLNGDFKGAMTFALTSVLDQYNYKISWKDLICNIHKLLAKKHFKQRPQISASQELSLDTIFFY